MERDVYRASVYEDSSWAVRRRKKQSLALHICTEQPQSPNSLIQHKCVEGCRRERFKQDLPSYLLIWYLFCKSLFLSNNDPYIPAVLIFFVLVIASHRAQPSICLFCANFIRCKACVLFAVQEFVLLVLYFLYIFISTWRLEDLSLTEFDYCPISWWVHWVCFLA